MKDFKDIINDIDSELCELQACIDIMRTVSDNISDVIRIPKGGQDYPQQLSVMLNLCTQKIETIREANDNVFKAVRL